MPDGRRTGFWHHRGVRHYDRAMLEIRAAGTPDGKVDGPSLLLIRRHCYTRTVSCYRYCTPGRSS
jgi:hypothetical protein